jgi:hypothetical protein
VPFRKRIAEIDRSIAELRASIESLRDQQADQASLEKLLSDLARLRAERLRLMEHQLLNQK